MKEQIKNLLAEKKVNMVIAFEVYKGVTRPIFVKNTTDIENIKLDADGPQNLVAYLKRKDIKAHYPIAIVSRWSEKLSLDLLIKEHQIKAEDVVIIDSKAIDQRTEKEKNLDKEIERLQALSHNERKDFWENHFSKCVRCYACRQSCPNCYCPQCKADKNRPAWVENSSHTRGNFSWNFLRAFHQAGRCVECGACESACSEGIPLMLINRMQNNIAKIAFGETDPNKPLLSSWSKDDDNSFFL